MMCRSAVSTGSRLGLWRPGRATIPAARRRLASAAAAAVHPEPVHQNHAPSHVSSQYQASEAAGVKFASRDVHPGPTTRLAVVVKAGTRYQFAEGLAVGLSEFAFKNTEKRSALRITREAELLGGKLSSYHTREALVLQASFLRDDLPYFTELLADVLTNTKYTTHEFHDDVLRVLHCKQAKLSTSDIALNEAHAVAFHYGLGNPLYPSQSTPLHVNEHYTAIYASLAYNKSNFSVVADGVNRTKLTGWLDTFFPNVPASPPSLPVALDAKPSKYFGGENRLPHKSGKSAMTIAFPGYSNVDNTAESAAMRVLASLLGGQSAIKWSPGFSLLSKMADGVPGATVQSTNFAYSDVGLFAIQISGAPTETGKAAAGAVKALKDVAEGSGAAAEDVTKAIARAKYELMEASEAEGPAGIVSTGMSMIQGGRLLQVADAVKTLGSVTVDQVKKAAQGLLDARATVATVGDLGRLPYAEELGLKV